MDAYGVKDAFIDVTNEHFKSLERNKPIYNTIPKPLLNKIMNKISKLKHKPTVYAYGTFFNSYTNDLKPNVQFIIDDYANIKSRIKTIKASNYTDCEKCNSIFKCESLQKMVNQNIDQHAIVVQIKESHVEVRVICTLFIETFNDIKIAVLERHTDDQSFKNHYFLISIKSTKTQRELVKCIEVKTEFVDSAYGNERHIVYENYVQELLNELKFKSDKTGNILTRRFGLYFIKPDWKKKINAKNSTLRVEDDDNTTTIFKNLDVKILPFINVACAYQTQYTEFDCFVYSLIHLFAMILEIPLNKINITEEHTMLVREEIASLIRKTPTIRNYPILDDTVQDSAAKRLYDDMDGYAIQTTQLSETVSEPKSTDHSYDNSIIESSPISKFVSNDDEDPLISKVIEEFYQNMEQIVKGCQIMDNESNHVHISMNPNSRIIESAQNVGKPKGVPALVRSNCIL